MKKVCFHVIKLTTGPMNLLLDHAGRSGLLSVQLEEAGFKHGDYVQLTHVTEGAPRPVRKVGIISSAWSHAAYSNDGKELIGYFDHDEMRIVTMEGGVVMEPGTFRVALVDETAWG